MLDDSEISGYREAVHPAFSQAFDVVGVASEGADHDSCLTSRHHDRVNWISRTVVIKQFGHGSSEAQGKVEGTHEESTHAWKSCDGINLG
jgi:hypothetical protein